MKKEIFYKIVISVLLGLNILQVSIPLFFSKGHHHRQHSFEKNILLNFDESQREVHRNLAKTHKKQMKELQKAQKEGVFSYFSAPNDSLLREITAFEAEKITITEQHFSDIEKILKPNQKEAFEEFKKQALLKIVNEKRPPKRRRE